jgi:hypothetical protein
MKKANTKLSITIEIASEEAADTSGPIAGCPQGYAVYAFAGTRNLQRVGGATCLSPSSGYSSATGSAFITVSAMLSSQLSNLVGANPSVAELRFAVCCPTSSPFMSVKPIAKARSKAKIKGKAKQGKARK